MSAQIVHFCNRQCRAEDLPEGDSSHFLDCPVWGFGDRSSLRSIRAASVPVLMVPVPPPTRSERIANIATIVVAATMIATLLALLASYFELV